MLYIGVDVGGMSAKAGVVTERGEILNKASCPTGKERGWEAVTRDMCAMVRRMVEESGHDETEIAAIGVGIPGVMDIVTREVPFCNNLQWWNVPLERTMEEALGKPVFVENDATVAGLAESVAGVSRGLKNSCFITLGTGIGGGFILDGKVFTGAHGVGSEIGHMVTHIGGVPCNCGQVGCWERYASASALIHFAQESAATHLDGALARSVGGDLSKITAKQVIDLARTGDAECVALFEEYVFNVCVGLSNLVNIFDPEMFVLGGGVSNAGAFLLDAVRQRLPKHIFYRSMPYARVELATLGNDAGIIGAAMLGRDMLGREKQV